MNQSSDLKNVLHKFEVGNTKAVTAPFAPYFNLSSQLSPTTNKDKALLEYASVFGYSIYAMVCTGLIISQAASMVSRYMHNLFKGYWHAMKWFFGTSKVHLRLVCPLKELRTKQIYVLGMWIYIMSIILINKDPSLEMCLL